MVKLEMRAIVTILAALYGVAASADEGAPPTEARRVRVTASGFGGQPVVGNLIAVEAGKVTVRRAGSSEIVAIPRGDVMRFENSTKRSRKGRGAGIGALVGLGVGAAVGFAAGDDCGAPDAPTFVCISRPVSAAGVGLAGAGLGAVLGLILAPGERWETVDAGSLHLTVGPSPGQSGGFHLALSLTF